MKLARSKRIFIDTSGWIELMLKGERFHQEVADYFANELQNDSKFFTSDYVLDEAFTRLLTHQSLRSAKLLHTTVNSASKENFLLILWTDETVFKQSWTLFNKYSEHKLSFTDATIAYFTQSLKLDIILSLDQGFKKVGLSIKPIVSL